MRFAAIIAATIVISTPAHAALDDKQWGQIGQWTFRQADGSCRMKALFADDGRTEVSLSASHPTARSTGSVGIMIKNMDWPTDAVASVSARGKVYRSILTVDAGTPIAAFSSGYREADGVLIMTDDTKLFDLMRDGKVLHYQVGKIAGEFPIGLSRAAVDAFWRCQAEATARH